MTKRMPGVTPSWRFPQPFGPRAVIALLLAALLLAVMGKRIEIDRMLAMIGQATLSAAGLDPRPGPADPSPPVLFRLFPPQISDRVEANRIENFDPERLPPFAHVEVVEQRADHLNPDTLLLEERVERVVYVVDPIGYLKHVAVKMLETLEIALWGTVLAVLVGFPLALLAARNVTPARPLNLAASAAASLLRSVPEMISALFLVLAFGFGPIAGVLALALHAAGFLGKFFAEDIANAPAGPQEALAAIGAGRLQVLRHAILPQLLPQFVGYTLYVFDRNARMATIIGLVGAGGIGQELKGRYDMYDHAHVGTILVAIFLVVLAIDKASAALRLRLA